MLLRLLVLVFGLGLCTALSWANTLAITPEDKIRHALKESFPEMHIDAIVLSPVPGMYQITSGGTVLYVSEDGRYIVSGELFDLNQRRKNVTELARRDARIQMLQLLDRRTAITFEAPNPKYTVFVFSDFDCTACKAFYAHVSELNLAGVELVFLGFPHEGKNSKGYQQALDVWCAPDRLAAFKAMARDGNLDALKAASKTTRTAICKAPLDEFILLGAKIGVRATPTLALQDGTLVQGVMEPSKLLELLEQVRVGSTNP